MEKKKNKDDDYIEKSKNFSVLALAMELGFLIAIPIVVLALLGRYFDKMYGTSPFLLLAGIILSAAITVYLIYRKFRDIIS